jgi:hypothetical protein
MTATNGDSSCDGGQWQLQRQGMAGEGRCAMATATAGNRSCNVVQRQAKAAAKMGNSTSTSGNCHFDMTAL